MTHRPIICYTRPEDYYAALLRMIADAGAIVVEVLNVLHSRQIDPVALSITVREIDMQLTRIKNELASGIEQMERLTFLGDDLFDMYQSVLNQRNALLAWIIVQEQKTEEEE